jgi:hypothetical protein
MKRMSDEHARAPKKKRVNVHELQHSTSSCGSERGKLRQTTQSGRAGTIAGMLAEDTAETCYMKRDGDEHAESSQAVELFLGLALLHISCGSRAETGSEQLTCTINGYVGRRDTLATAQNKLAVDEAVALHTRELPRTIDSSLHGFLVSGLICVISGSYGK